MLTTGAATAIALVTLIVSCLVGGIVGYFTCWSCRLPWNFKVALGDVGVVAVVSIASAYAYSAIAMARGHMDSGVKWILLTAAASVIVRHLIRLALRAGN